MTCVGSGVELVICPAAMKESAYIPYVREHLEHLKVFAYEPSFRGKCWPGLASNCLAHQFYRVGLCMALKTGTPSEPHFGVAKGSTGMHQNPCKIPRLEVKSKCFVWKM